VSTAANLGAALRAARVPAALVLVSTCAGVAGAYAVTTQMEPVYQARASVVVSAYTRPVPVGSEEPEGRAQQPSAAPAYDPNSSQAMVPTVARLAESTALALEVAEQAHLPSEAVVGQIDASYEPGVQIVTLTASAPSPRQAARVANIATDVLRAKVAAGGSLGRRGTLHAQPLDEAVPPTTPALPKPMLNDALGGLLGLLVGIGLVMLRNHLDDRLRWADQIEAELGLPVLAALPPAPARHLRRGARRAFQRRRMARAVRAGVAALSPLTAHSGRRLLVVGVDQATEAAYAASLLALGLAEQHYQVILLEGQLDHPTLARHFPASAEHTIQQVLSAHDAVPPAAPVALRVVPAEPTDPEIRRALLRSGPFARLISAAATGSDVVLLTGPGVLTSGDVSALAPHADAAVLVLRADWTRVSDAHRAVGVLHRLGLPVAGVVVVNALDAGRRWHRRDVALTGVPVEDTTTRVVEQPHEASTARIARAGIAAASSWSPAPARSGVSSDSSVTSSAPAKEPAAAKDSSAEDEAVEDAAASDKTPAMGH
jgi:capsular polysaccharide biosynthesis protein